MKLKRDNLERYVLEDEDGAELYLEVDEKGKYLSIYQGHTEPNINDRLESLEVTNFLTLENVDTLIWALISCAEEMEKKNETL